jgi:hypothetical protein
MKICVGIDAAKVTHWAVAVDGEGRGGGGRAGRRTPPAPRGGAGGGARAAAHPPARLAPTP